MRSVPMLAEAARHSLSAGGCAPTVLAGLVLPAILSTTVVAALYLIKSALGIDRMR